MSITQLSHQSLPSHTKLNGIFPQEVLYQIFNFADLSRKDLKACGLVCKLWNQVSTHNRLWYKCCIKELSLKMEKNRFESININTFSYSVDYKNLYNKYTVIKFPFRFFHRFRRDLEIIKNGAGLLNEKVDARLIYFVCVSCCIFVHVPSWSLSDLINRVKHAWTKENEICRCSSCVDTRVHLFSWDADARKQKKLEKERRINRRQRNVPYDFSL